MGPKQEWEAPMNPLSIKVPAFSSKNYKSCLTKNEMKGEFRLNLTLQNEKKPFTINGKIEILDH